MEKTQDVVETYSDINLKEGQKVGGCREYDSRYGSEIEINKETDSGACTNSLHIDIISEPGPGGADRNAYSRNQANSATIIHETSSESIKVA